MAEDLQFSLNYYRILSNKNTELLDQLYGHITVLQKAAIGSFEYETRLASFAIALDISKTNKVYMSNMHDRIMETLWESFRCFHVERSLARIIHYNGIAYLNQSNVPVAAPHQSPHREMLQPFFDYEIQQKKPRAYKRKQKPGSVQTNNLDLGNSNSLVKEKPLGAGFNNLQYQHQEASTSKASSKPRAYKRKPKAGSVQTMNLDSGNSNSLVKEKPLGAGFNNLQDQLQEPSTSKASSKPRAYKRKPKAGSVQTMNLDSGNSNSLVKEKPLGAGFNNLQDHQQEASTSKASSKPRAYKRKPKAGDVQVPSLNLGNCNSLNLLDHQEDKLDSTLTSRSKPTVAQEEVYERYVDMKFKRKRIWENACNNNNNTTVPLNLTPNPLMHPSSSQNYAGVQTITAGSSLWQPVNEDIFKTPELKGHLALETEVVAPGQKQQQTAVASISCQVIEHEIEVGQKRFIDQKFKRKQTLEQTCNITNNTSMPSTSCHLTGHKVEARKLKLSIAQEEKNVEQETCINLKYKRSLSPNKNYDEQNNMILPLNQPSASNSNQNYANKQKLTSVPDAYQPISAGNFRSVEKNDGIASIEQISAKNSEHAIETSALRSMQQETDSRILNPNVAESPLKKLLLQVTGQSRSKFSSHQTLKMEDLEEARAKIWQATKKKTHLTPKTRTWAQLDILDPPPFVPPSRDDLKLPNWLKSFNDSHDIQSYHKLPHQEEQQNPVQSENVQAGSHALMNLENNISSEWTEYRTRNDMDTSDSENERLLLSRIAKRNEIRWQTTRCVVPSYYEEEQNPQVETQCPYQELDPYHNQAECPYEDHILNLCNNQIYQDFNQSDENLNSNEGPNLYQDQEDYLNNNECGYEDQK